jgi:carbamoyl-phosphate synthase large subunit
MTRRARRAAIRVVLVLVVATVGFALLQAPTRRLEARATALALHLVAGGRSPLTLGPEIVVLPPHGFPFAAVITPACSVLASVLALVCLAALVASTRGRSVARQAAALGAAVAIVCAGNVARMAAVLWVGSVGGLGALVLFHDWVGAVFTFGYTLFGYIFMLFLVLPRRAGGAAGIPA